MKIIINEMIPVYETDTGERVVNARELHEFLEVGRDFTNWIKDRIDKYSFEEGNDFVVTFTKTGERQNVTRHDYNLKLDMAKEIAMLEGNVQGKKVRKYFIAVENNSKTNPHIDIALLSPEMQMFKQIWDAQAIKHIEDKQRDEKINRLESGITTIQETLTRRDDDWRKSINSMLNGASYRSGGNFSDLRSESYRVLEERGHCDLKRRVRNLKDRLAESGATKTKIEAVGRLDIIEVDVKLKEIYTSIVKEISIGTLKIAK